jgi:Na+-transporting methylmalonyl-CoA/oxaloacetate decarboxylase gamma subunit
MNQDLKHDLLLFLKCILLPVYGIGIVIFFILIIPLGTINWFIGFRTPYTILEVTASKAEQLWGKLPKFGDNE